MARRRDDNRRNPNELLIMMRFEQALERLEAAKAKGTSGYIWRTMMDDRVRDCHQILEGHYFDWDSPPLIDTNGTRGHPGMAYNCRCTPDPFQRGAGPTEEQPHQPAGSRATFRDYRRMRRW